MKKPIRATDNKFFEVTIMISKRNKRLWKNGHIVLKNNDRKKKIPGLASKFRS